MSQEKPQVYSAKFIESAVKLTNESDKPSAPGLANIVALWKLPRRFIYDELKPLKKENTRLIEVRDQLLAPFG